MRIKVENIFRILVAVFSAMILAISCRPSDRYVTITGYAQGGTYAVKFNLNGKDGMIKIRPEEIRDSVDAILRNVDMSLSGYNKKSLLSRFNDGEAVVPDSLFVDMYNQSRRFFHETGGCVDVASAPLFDLWGFGFTAEEMPSDSAVNAALSESGSARLADDMRTVLSDDGSVSGKDLILDGSAFPKLNYNAVAQGYSCDLVADYLYSIGVRDMMVDIGEIFCDGRNPSGRQWTLGIDRPEDGNNESGAKVQAVFKAPDGPHGIVTSGNYRKYYVRDGKKYAHTLDPRTGYPVEHSLLSATVVAPDALSADAYATYCMVIGLEESKRFISSRPDLECCLIYDDDGNFRTWCSDGFVLEE